MTLAVSAATPRRAIIPTHTAIDVLKRAIQSAQIAPTAANGTLVMTMSDCAAPLKFM